MSNQEHTDGLTRRTLIKSTALGSLALAAGGLSLPFSLRNAAAAVQDATRGEERIVWGACSVNCGSRCALRSHVRDDEVVWVETDNTGADIYGDHQVRACLRGRSIRRRINHPDRLNYPMKRVGKRGEGKFVRISWEEALDTIAGNLKRIVKDYGNEAVYINYSSGIVGGNMTRSSPTASPVMRLMNCYGGSLNQYGTYSTAQIACAMPYTYGSNDGNSTSDIENSKLVVMFGNNPAETRMSGGGITYYLEQARERSNARMIVIDPRYTDTASINTASVTMRKRCRQMPRRTGITKRIFSARVTTARRKPHNGHRGSPAFPSTASSSWHGKSAARNRLIFARDGDRSARLTVNCRPERSPCCRY